MTRVLDRVALGLQGFGKHLEDGLYHHEIMKFY